MYALFTQLTDAESFCTAADTLYGYPKYADAATGSGIQASEELAATLHYCSILHTGEYYAVQIDADLLSLLPQGVILAASLPDPFGGGN